MMTKATRVTNVLFRVSTAWNKRRKAAQIKWREAAVAGIKHAERLKARRNKSQ